MLFLNKGPKVRSFYIKEKSLNERQINLVQK